MSECLSCKSNSGEKRISPGVTIHNGKYWVVEHAYPSGLLGWIVIVLKRHSEKLHELSNEEWNELAEIQFKIINILHKHLNTYKEYTCCFATGEGFKHIHFHVIPISADYDEYYKGARAFHYLRESECEIIPAEKVKVFCEVIKSEFGNYYWEIQQ